MCMYFFVFLDKDRWTRIFGHPNNRTVPVPMYHDNRICLLRPLSAAACWMRVESRRGVSVAMDVAFKGLLFVPTYVAFARCAHARPAVTFVGSLPS